MTNRRVRHLRTGDLATVVAERDSEGFLVVAWDDSPDVTEPVHEDTVGDPDAVEFWRQTWGSEVAE